MRVVVAPDSFKGTLSASEAAEALAAGWRSVTPASEAVLRPMADGGEGTLDAFAAAVAGSRAMPVTVTGPHGKPVATRWLFLPPDEAAIGGTAVVDLASTSGIELLGDERLPWDAGTAGFGEAITAALDAGVSRLVLGIGSSASTDAGSGLLTALGARITDATDSPIPPGARGMMRARAADLSELRPAPLVRVLTDVTNPLTGPRGAAAVFGPQKGFAASDLDAVDQALARFAEFLAVDPHTPGAGAAGGTGAALLAWGAELVPGAVEVATLIGLAEAIADADVVVTGEGSYDGQSGDGKVPSHVAQLARDAGVPVVLAAGRITPDADTSLFSASVSLTELAGSSHAALAEPAVWLQRAGAQLAHQVSAVSRGR